MDLCGSLAELGPPFEPVAARIHLSRKRSAVRVTANEHLSEKPEGNDQGNDVFPPDAGQDPAAWTRRTSEGLPGEPRPAADSGRRLHEFSSRELRRPNATGS